MTAFAACSRVPLDPPIQFGLVSWGDPKDATTLTMSGSNVTSVRDKWSGGTWSQLGAGPTVDTIAGTVALLGNGSTQQLTTTNAAVVAALTPGQPYTLVFIAQASALDTGVAMFGAGNAGVSTNDSRIWGQDTGGSGAWNTTIRDGSGGSFVHSSQTVYPQGTDLNPHVFFWHGDGAHESLRLDNIAADPPGESESPAATAITRVSLFSRPDLAPDSFFAGRIGEWLIFNRELASDERAYLYSWLTKRTPIGPTPLPQPTVDPSIVDVIFISGQSNASGVATRPPDVPAGLLMWVNDIGYYTSAGLEPLAMHPGILGISHGVELELGVLFSSVGLTSVSVKVSESATGLRPTWLPPTGTNWPTLAADWNTVLGLLAVQFPGKTFRYHFIWIQGEHEVRLAAGDPDATGYQGYLETLIDGVRALPQLAGCDFHVIESHNIAGANNLAVMQAAQVAVTATRANVYVYSSDAYNNVDNTRVHYCASGFQGPGSSMARDIGAGMLSLLP